MSRLRNFRNNIIPSGACVERPTTEAFLRIDNDRSHEVSSNLAQLACGECRQLTYCQAQTEPIAQELRVRGVRHAVIGGTLVQVSQLPGIENPHESYLQFDLSDLPEKPQQQLHFLRQGVRTGQLKLLSRTPHGALAIMQRCKQELSKRNPHLSESINQELAEADFTQALRNVILILCQQADFKRFAINKLSTDTVYSRFQSDNFDFRNLYPTIERYLQDTLSLKQLGFQRPGYVAAYHSPEFCDKTVEHFFRFRDTNRSLLRQVIENNLATPLPALERFVKRLELITQQNPEARHTNRARWAMGSRTIEEFVDTPIRRVPSQRKVSDEHSS